MVRLKHFAMPQFEGSQRTAMAIKALVFGLYKNVLFCFSDDRALKQGTV